jgi:hypothetical protein
MVPSGSYESEPSNETATFTEPERSEPAFATGSWFTALVVVVVVLAGVVVVEVVAATVVVVVFVVVVVDDVVVVVVFVVVVVDVVDVVVVVVLRPLAAARTGWKAQQRTSTPTSARTMALTAPTSPIAFRM